MSRKKVLSSEQSRFADMGPTSRRSQRVRVLEERGALRGASEWIVKLSHTGGQWMKNIGVLAGCSNDGKNTSGQMRRAPGPDGRRNGGENCGFSAKKKQSV